MQKTLQAVASVSLIFFIIFGIAHISVSMLVAQEVIDRPTFILFNTLDLPFLLATLIYGTSKLTLIAERITGNIKIPLIICAALSVVLFLIALYFNFILPDAQLSR